MHYTHLSFGEQFVIEILFKKKVSIRDDCKVFATQSRIPSVEKLENKHTMMYRKLIVVLTYADTEAREHVSK